MSTYILQARVIHFDLVGLEIDIGPCIPNLWEDLYIPELVFTLQKRVVPTAIGSAFYEVKPTSPWGPHIQWSDQYIVGPRMKWAPKI